MPPKEPGDGGGDGGEGGDGGSGGGGNNGGDGGGDGGNNGGGDGTGGGDGSGNGDGSGDGGGTGGGDKPGEEEGKCDPAKDPSCKPSSVTGEACETSLQCDGDAIQCAILRQQKQARCDAQEMNDFEKNKEKISKLFQGEEFKAQPDQEVEIPSFISQSGRFLPSGCPPDKQFSLFTGGGHSFTFSYKPLCAFASDLGVLIVVAASIFATLYVGRGFGGE
ncbi:virulence factor TspB C-terminal domain-related protein [Pseudomonas aeruginosa]|uniref:virulence factor TspB C-terminal domain-related protein n=1 Tax=Pseudomonas aeruginosa TaxID=287 RepID=UPI0026E00172|nr:virulence factor TspB C-terminal domain-related protein [Pseudomonas aeruginosa]MDO5934485.1 virulence factor TspB C-terminal domain-related protein [Pseudomonas aeruginosa]MDO5934497.1 virulence factor TspB C-terminal domain-related protein [Pseudomonas aeruginosa]MDO5948617.1 virulence factor TspB C-terminal domain-related protein [Pseudomonas aeruginosa]MDO5948629.1 virulence factor TspB C-terminal domain-related protein [Pseudomonas aeruginosa]HCP6207256.1 hypothetical protein [Pseudomo